MKREDSFELRASSLELRALSCGAEETAGPSTAFGYRLTALGMTEYWNYARDDRGMWWFDSNWHANLAMIEGSYLSGS